MLFIFIFIMLLFLQLLFYYYYVRCRHKENKRGPDEYLCYQIRYKFHILHVYVVHFEIEVGGSIGGQIDWTKGRKMRWDGRKRERTDG